MTNKITAKSVALAAGACFAISLAASPAAMADSNPFSINKLSTDSGMQLASGKCGEGKCGANKDSMPKDGKCGTKEMGKGKEGKCGEGKCGGNKGMEEGKCGGSKKNMGEGKCGGK